MGRAPFRLVQLQHPHLGRRIAVVEEPNLVLLRGFGSIYEMALEAIDHQHSPHYLVSTHWTGETIFYDAVYEGIDEWKLLPSFDSPHNPTACLVSGTGLTHMNSAMNRQMMHRSEDDVATDSMIMYQWGVEGGKPMNGKIGAQPEWFYKGRGEVLRAHGQPLEIPPYGEDGGEEAEVAGVYIVDKEGSPWRIGFTPGNEFSDHVMEKKNYLYLAPSKLRQCAIGPELLITDDFKAVNGLISVERNNQQLWSAEIHTGEDFMAHSLRNLEYHHFKYAFHRIPFQSHVHFFGADAFSYGSGIQLKEGDWMRISWSGMGRPLENVLKHSPQRTGPYYFQSQSLCNIHDG
jgi:hypothetical protein